LITSIKSIKPRLQIVKNSKRTISIHTFPKTADYDIIDTLAVTWRWSQEIHSQWRRKRWWVSVPGVRTSEGSV